MNNDDDIVESELLLNNINGDTLKISQDGVYLAIYQKYDAHGFVYNLNSKKTTFQFQVFHLEKKSVNAKF